MSSSLFPRSGFFPADHHGGNKGWTNAAEVQLRRVVPTAPCAVEGHGRKGSSIIFRGPDSRQPRALPRGGVSVGHKQLCCERDLLCQQPPSWRGENGDFFFLRLVIRVCLSTLGNKYEDQPRLFVLLMVDFLLD